MIHAEEVILMTLNLPFRFIFIKSLLFCFLSFLIVSQAMACVGPPKPRCAKGLQMQKFLPFAFLPAGTANIPINVSNLFTLQNIVPPGTPPICPAAATSSTVTLTATCFPGGAVSTIGPVPHPGGVLPVNVRVLNGFNIPIVPSPIPRFCLITGQTDVTLPDGMALTAVGDAQVCLVEEVSPGVPRLSLELLTPSEIAVHPGDQSEHIIRLTNNDPNDTFVGSVDLSMLQTDRLPGMTAGISTPESGVFSFAEPVAGDNFPVGFEKELDPDLMCLPLPANPGDVAPKTASEPIVLLPGEVKELSIYTRPWGLCPQCGGENNITINGSFGGAPTGVAACGTVATISDPEVAPTYQCKDAGAKGQLFPVAANVTQILAQPTLLDSVEITLNDLGGELLIDGIPSGSALGSDSYNHEFQGLTGSHDDLRRNLQIQAFVEPEVQLQFIATVQLTSPNGQVVIDNLDPAVPNNTDTIAGTKIKGHIEGTDSVFEIMDLLSINVMDTSQPTVVPIELVALSLQSIQPITINTQNDAYEIIVNIDPNPIASQPQPAQIELNGDVRAYVGNLAPSSTFVPALPLFGFLALAVGLFGIAVIRNRK